MPRRPAFFRPRLSPLECRLVPATVLSDNLSNVSAGTDTATGARWLASSFLTDNAAHSLTSVTLKLGGTGTAAVDLYSNATLQPASKLATLTSPVSYPTSPAATVFTSSGVSLTANTVYWVVLRAPTGSFDWSYTADNAGTPTATFQHTHGETDDAGATWFTGNIFPNQMTVTADESSTAPGTLAFSAATYTVGEAGGSVTVTVTRTGGSDGAVSVPVTVNGGTATSGTDFTGLPATASFAAGATSADVVIPITNDTLVEGTETISLALGAPTGGATLGTQTTSTVSITDDDRTVAFGAATYTGAESGTVTITLTRTGSLVAADTVPVSVTGGTATAGSDFTGPAGTATFAAGASSATVTIDVTDDTLAEGTETITLALGTPTGGATLGTQKTATVSLTDNDTAVELSAATYSVGEAAGTATITLTRAGSLTGSTSVTLSATGGTATGADYSGLPVTVTFAAGVATASATVTVVNDTAVEGDETITLGLSGPTGGATLGSQSTATLTIQDDDSAIAFGAATYTVSEGGGSATITLTRTGVLGTAATVLLSATGGTATAGSDYSGLPVTVTLPAGQASVTVSVPVLDDTTAEGSETVQLALGTPSGVYLGSPGTAVLTIADNDTSIRFAAGSTAVTVAESAGTVTLTLTRVGDVSAAGSVTVSAAGGSATAADYSGLPAVASFAAGAATTTVSFTVADDLLVEASETIQLALGSPTGGATVGSPGTATVTITDDDSAFAFATAAAAADEADGTFTVTVVRTGLLTAAATVDVVQTGGTATVGSDYTGLPATVTFAAGQSTATVVLTILDDADIEGDETLVLGLTNPTGGASVGDPAADTITLVDNDTAPSPGVVSVADAAVTAAEGGAAVTVRLVRAGGSAGAVSVTVTASSGTATLGSDFTFAPTTVSFADGQTAASFTVTVLDDNLVEGTESVTFTLGDPMGGVTLGTVVQSTVTLTDNDTAGPVQFAVAGYAVDEAAGTVTLTITRTGSTASPGTVDYATAPGTAGGTDYTPTTGTVSFAAGQTSATIAVPILQDALGEGSEQFTVTLSNATGGAVLGSPVTATVTITDDSATVGLSATTITVDEAAGTATVTLSRTGTLSAAGTVSYATADGTAVAGTDYTATSGSVTFLAGQGSATITVPILNNSIFAGDRAFTLMLSGAGGELALGAATTATVTITEDDPAQPGAIAFAAATYAAGEGAGTVLLTLTRTGGSDGAVSVLVSAAGGTADGGDYTGLPATVTFAAGQTSATVVLTLTDDTLTEGDESLTLALSAPTGGATLGGQATAVLTLTDNDAPATITFASTTLTATEGGTALVVTLVRSGSTAGAVSVVVSAAGGTASNGDYSGLPATVTFAAGQTTAMLTIPLTDDATAEGAETLQLALGSPTGGAVVGSQGTATVTVVDNDPAVTGSVSFVSTALSASEGGKTLALALTRTGGSSGVLTVPVTATGGTATAGSDYTGLPASVTFADGQTAATLTLTLVDDATAEGPETLVLSVGGSTATVTLADREQSIAVAGGSGTSAVTLLATGGATVRTLTPFPGFTGGVRVATADVTGDGVDDLIVGAGPGSASLVRVYDGLSGAELVTITVFETSFTGGVYVAAGDMDGDGKAEVVVTPDEGGGPAVVVYSGAGLTNKAATELARFYGIDDAAFRGGARPAVGDINGDGAADLVVAAGFGGGPRVAVYEGRSVAAGRSPTRLLADFYAFEGALRNGSYVAVGDVDGDGKADLMFGGGPGGGPRVRVYTAAGLLAAAAFEKLDDAPTSALLADVFAGDSSLRGGVRLAAGDFDGDGTTDLLTASGAGEASAVRVYKAATVKAGAAAPDLTLDPFGATFSGGVYVG